ncbi:nuclear transport factor 2 family protein [Streptomyces sp. NPDC045431]|uniref:nuclear transport factor 2 family protein n=1 Tax=Streptomyces sp. NPDC045431 TaxID=3155613 RepID=UPI0033DA77DA
MPPVTDLLTRSAVERTVTDWYAALDRHAPVEEVLHHLVPRGLVMRFPEGPVRGLAGFRSWYRKVCALYFDEVHRVDAVTVRPVDPRSAEVEVAVSWRARVWSPPDAYSRTLDFDARQTWSVVLLDGRPRIRGYTVDALTPRAGSPVPAHA